MFQIQPHQVLQQAIPRNKVALKKGRGLMDWVRLGHTAPDLAGTGGKLLKITQMSYQNITKEMMHGLLLKEKFIISRLILNFIREEKRN
ncbi:hypothetical protein Avbf_03085 [Armadillidium vulgare]|nr:hypothetical protein Avbf_03085 [Armadillidium vulgare]